MTGASGGETERQASAEQREAAMRRVRETVGRMLRDGEVRPH